MLRRCPSIVVRRLTQSALSFIMRPIPSNQLIFRQFFVFCLVAGFYNGELGHLGRCYFFSKPCIRMMLVNSLYAVNAENRIKLLEF